MQDRVAIIAGGCRSAFNTLVKGNVEVRRLPLAEEPGAPAPMAARGRSTARSRARSGSTCAPPAAHPLFAARPRLSRGDSGPCVAGRICFNRMPLIRTMLAFNAYSEGWALYAEQLADELGVYAENPIGEARLSPVLAFRACRLVVDTGIHAKRWTRAAGDRLASSPNGSSLEEVSGEVDRYCSWPGQACGYKVGHTAIVRLRERARGGAGRSLRLQGVQRRGGARRQCADDRAGACDRSSHRGAKSVARKHVMPATAGISGD
jgi:hypothetical protein